SARGIRLWSKTGWQADAATHGKRLTDRRCVLPWATAWQAWIIGPAKHRKCAAQGRRAQTGRHRQDVTGPERTRFGGCFIARRKRPAGAAGPPSDAGRKRGALRKLADDHCPRQLVMPSLLAGVERHPEQSQAQRQRGQQVGEVTAYRLPRGQGV